MIEAARCTVQVQPQTQIGDDVRRGVPYPHGQDMLRRSGPLAGLHDQSGVHGLGLRQQGEQNGKQGHASILGFPPREAPYVPENDRIPGCRMREKAIVYGLGLRARQKRRRMGE
jgi:hypothetical protein